MKPDFEIKLLNPRLSARLGRIRHVLFDFDGTISLLREGWESVMIPMMLEMISPLQAASPEIEQEVRRYVDESTGMLTIRQMEWLAEAVQRNGLAREALAAQEYKAIYVRRILAKVEQRVGAIARRESTLEMHQVAGAAGFLERLAKRGAILYLASGTDHADVVNEARILGLASYFNDRIFGALDISEAHDKERLIQRILAENGLHGRELLVIGDGPVEIRVAAAQGAIAVGVASDEMRRCGWDERKIDRLVNAGADLLIPDFAQSEALVRFLFPEG
jgi:phosphoglycolate phosphatase-like HAD superfamily hydrolase